MDFESLGTRQNKTLMTRGMPGQEKKYSKNRLFRVENISKKQRRFTHGNPYPHNFAYPK